MVQAHSAPFDGAFMVSAVQHPVAAPWQLARKRQLWRGWNKRRRTEKGRTGRGAKAALRRANRRETVRSGFVRYYCLGTFGVPMSPATPHQPQPDPAVLKKVN